MDNLLGTILRGGAGESQPENNYAPAVGAMEDALKLPKGSLTGGKNFVGSDQFSTLTPVIDSYARVKGMQAMRQMQHPALSPEMAGYIGNGDLEGAIKQHGVESPGEPFPAQFMSLVNAAKGTNAKSALTGTLRDRVSTQQAQQAEGLGQTLAGLKTSGDFSTQNNKTSAAFHAWQILEQGYDPKTGQFNVPPTRYGELAQTAATLATGSSQMSDDRVNQIRQRTLAGDLGGALTYATGSGQWQGAPQDILRQLGGMIVRQGTTGQQLRDNYMNSATGAYSSLKQINPQMYDATVKDTLGTAPDFTGYIQRSPMFSQFKDELTGLQSNPISGSMPSSNQPSMPQKPINTNGRVHFRTKDGKTGYMAAPDFFKASTDPDVLARKIP